MKNQIKIPTILFLIIIGICSCDTSTFEDIEPEPVEPNPMEIISYDEDVVPIMSASCTSCHSPNGQAAFYPLVNYSQVSSGITNILDRVERPDGDPLKMPVGGSLTSAQIQVLNDWNDNGLVESE